MTLTIIISAATVIAMSATVLTKPYIRIKNFNLGLYWAVCLLGAILLIATGCISIKKVIEGITENSAVNPLKILALFLSMTAISLYLGDSEFFDAVAKKLFSKTNGGQKKLFFSLYAVVAILTVFTSNDIIILTFTPPLLLFSKKAKISPFPFLFAEFIAANTWSMALVVGNPTNVYLSTAGIGFFNYLSRMWLPAVSGEITGLIILYLVFRKSLSLPINNRNLTPCSSLSGATPETTVDKFNMFSALTILALTVIALAVSDFVGVQMWLICVVGFGILFLVTLTKEILTTKSVKKTFRVLTGAPFELIPFILSMFVIVLSLKENGVTNILSSALVSGEKTDGVVFAFLSAAGSNLLNNIPMSVLFSNIASGNLYATLGSVIGSNIGAYITPVGALAGIMWNKILSDYNVKLPFYKFVLYGSIVAIPTLLVSSAALLIF